jgi:hypothetical protein
MTEVVRVRLALIRLNTGLRGSDGTVWTVRSILDVPPPNSGERVKLLEAVDSHTNIVVLERRVSGSRYEQRALRATSIRNNPHQWGIVAARPLHLVAAG